MLPFDTPQLPEETMKTSFSRKQLTLAVACALALGLTSGFAQAQNFGSNESREVWKAAPAQIWKNGFGECWHSAYGPPPAYNECNPAPAAQYVAPAPAPIVLAAAPPQPVYEKVTLDANVLFDFDKSVLRPEGRKTLDAFAENLKSINSAEIAAVGFADRFGTDGYNQALSERRVATVKAYLVAKGIEPKWGVHSSAKGESQPTTAAGECKGATPNAGNIACLQPDRHVSVEITGNQLKK
jgi:OmpA-OmpF porin, OOP family